MRSPAVMAALAVSAAWGTSHTLRRVLQRLGRDVVAASTTEREVLKYLQKIRQEMRPDLPALDEQIDGMMGLGMKPRLAIVT